MFKKFFGWLKSLFSGSQSYDMYKPRERKIFSYWKGEKERWVKVDPMVIFKRIMDKAPEISIEMSVSDSISKDATKAHGDLVRRLQGIFEVKPLEEDGLTEPEVLGLFDHFMEYIDTLKKNTRKSLTSPPESTGSNPILEENQPTQSSSGTGSTRKEPSTEGLGPMPTELPLL